MSDEKAALQANAEGLKYLDGKDIYKARQLFSKAIDLSSDLLKTSGNSQHAAETHASFLSNRAKAHLQLGDFPAVIDDTSAALLKFEHAEIFYLRGVAKFWIGNTRDAAEDLKQATQSFGFRDDLQEWLYPNLQSLQQACATRLQHIDGIRFLQEVDRAVCCVYKLNTIPKGAQPQYDGGIVGTAFFISQQHLLTGTHVLQNSFTPADGYEVAHIWLVSRDGAFKEVIEIGMFEDLGSDICLITLKEEDPLKLRPVAKPLTKLGNPAACGPVIALGHDAARRAGLVPVGADQEYRWRPERIPDPWVADECGQVSVCGPKEFGCPGLKVKAQVLWLSFGGPQGRSGGPVLDASTGALLGVTVAGDPPGAMHKRLMMAVSAEHLRTIKSLNSYWDK